MTNKKRAKSFIVGIAVTILLPLSFFMVAKMLKNDRLAMPHHFRIEKINTTIRDGKTVKDTLFHQVADITLINQLNDTVSLNQDLKGKILVIDFFFATCPSVCPRLTENMKMLQRAFRKVPKREYALEEHVQLLSITVNPTADSVSVIRSYANKHEVNHDKWWFLTGNKEAIYNYARNELGLSLQPGDGNAEDFLHTQKIVVLDNDRFIRGYYDGLDSIAIAQCAYDISLLTLEKKKQKK